MIEIINADANKDIKSINRVIYFEPQCAGKQHASFNAHTVNGSVGCEDIYLIAAQSHMDELAKLITVPSKSILIPEIPKNPILKLVHFFKCIIRAKSFKKSNAQLVFLSMSAAQLLMAPLCCIFFSRVVIYHHGLAENIFSDRRITRYGFRLIFIYLGLMRRIENVFLGLHIKESFSNDWILMKNFRFIRHPFEAGKLLQPARRKRGRFKVITFGQQTFEKGFLDNLWLYDQLCKFNVECEIVGFANQSVIQYLDTLVKKPPITALMCSRDYLEKNISDSDLIFFTYPKNLYRATSSGAYFDALSFGKPVLAYRGNKFFEYEFTLNEKLHLCADKESMLKEILKLRECALNGHDTDPVTSG